MTRRVNMTTRKTPNLLAVTLLLLATAASAQTLPVTYQANAINMSDMDQPGLFQLEIRIERWTEQAEFDSLRDALLEKGSDGLLRQLLDLKSVGRIRARTGGLGWDLRFARVSELPGGGRRVVFATDRPMSFYERTTRPLSSDYEFFLGEMRLGADGTGEG